MVDHYLPREEVPYKQQIITRDVFKVTEKEHVRLCKLHNRLYRILNATHRMLGSDVLLRRTGTGEWIRNFLKNPDHHALKGDGRDVTFMTTEIVLDQHRNPFIVSVDAHSARHWDDIALLSRENIGNLTSAHQFVEAIGMHFQDRELVIVRDSQGCERYSGLCRMLNRSGISVIHRTASEVENELEHSWQCLLELPFMQVRKQRRQRMYERASFLIQPHAYLSSQRVLAMLGREECYDALADASHPSFTREEFQKVQRAIPRTQLMERDTEVDPDRLVKLSAPLTSQCCIGSYQAVSPMEISRRANGMVAQERIRPFTMFVPALGSMLPVRLILISYRGSILTGIAIAGDSSQRVKFQEAHMPVMIG